MQSNDLDKSIYNIPATWQVYTSIKYLVLLLYADIMYTTSIYYHLKLSLTISVTLIPFICYFTKEAHD